MTKIVARIQQVIDTCGPEKAVAMGNNLQFYSGKVYYIQDRSLSFFLRGVGVEACWSSLLCTLFSSCSAWMPHCLIFSCCRPQALGAWASVAVACGLQTAQQLWWMGLVAPWHVESSWIGDQTCVSCNADLTCVLIC